MPRNISWFQRTPQQYAEIEAFDVIARVRLPAEKTDVPCWVGDLPTFYAGKTESK